MFKFAVAEMFDSVHVEWNMRGSSRIHYEPQNSVYKKNSQFWDYVSAYLGCTTLSWIWEDRNSYAIQFWKSFWRNYIYYWKEVYHTNYLYYNIANYDNVEICLTIHFWKKIAKSMPNIENPGESFTSKFTSFKQIQLRLYYFHSFLDWRHLVDGDV